MTIPPRTLALRDRVVHLQRPWLMGIVNASPESFSDGAEVGDVGRQVERGAQLLADGADVLDVGGESGVTGIPAIDAAEEIARVVPVIRRLVDELGAIVSVDTYKPQVAAAALEAGAHIVNDVSGLLHPELATHCAQSGAALVVMHTRTPPKIKRTDPALYDDVGADLQQFFDERIAVARQRGVEAEQLILDPGPDFAKTPRQTIDALHALPQLHARYERPLLLAISRKDFIGAITGRPPKQRDAGTLAALGWSVKQGAQLVRLHDIAAARDYLATTAALNGEEPVSPQLLLDPALRRQAPAT